MELVALYKRVIGLDMHQAQIMACALIEKADGGMRIEQRQFRGVQARRRTGPRGRRPWAPTAW